MQYVIIVPTTGPCRRMAPYRLPREQNQRVHNTSPQDRNYPTYHLTFSSKYNHQDSLYVAAATLTARIVLLLSSYSTSTKLTAIYYLSDKYYVISNGSPIQQVAQVPPWPSICPLEATTNTRRYQIPAKRDLIIRTRGTIPTPCNSRQVQHFPDSPSRGQAVKQDIMVRCKHEITKILQNL